MIFVCTDFKGRWPVGTAAVIEAEDERTARRLLADELERAGLVQDENYPPSVKPFAGPVEILNDGDY